MLTFSLIRLLDLPSRSHLLLNSSRINKPFLYQLFALSNKIPRKFLSAVLYGSSWNELLFFDVYYICLSRNSHSIGFCYTISINGKKITQRKIRASKSNFVFNKSCRTCLCRKKGLYTTINLLQFHSTWFHTVNKFILFMITNDGCFSFWKRIEIIQKKTKVETMANHLWAATS